MVGETGFRRRHHPRTLHIPVQAVTPRHGAHQAVGEQANTGGLAALRGDVAGGQRTHVCHLAAAAERQQNGGDYSEQSHQAIDSQGQVKAGGSSG